MTRRLALVTAALMAAAVVLPLALALALVPEPGGSGVVRGTIWVANEGSDGLTAIDADTHAVVTVLRGVAGPHNVQVAPDGRTVWVTSTPRDLVAAIDARTLRVRATVTTGDEPAHVVLAPDGATALVTNGAGDSLTIVDTATLRTAHLPTGQGPHGLRPHPNGRLALVAEARGGTASLIDVRDRRTLSRIPVGAGPVQVAFAPDGRFAFVTLGTAGAIVKVDLARARVVARTRVARRPIQIVVTPDGATVLAASQGTVARPEETLTFLDARTLRRLATVATGSGAHGVAVEPTGRQAYVTDVWAGDVAVVDLASRRVVDRIPVGGEPNGISFSPVVQPHARGAANMNSPVVKTLALGGRTDGRGSAGYHSH